MLTYKRLWIIISYDMIHWYVRDNSHELTIIYVNLILKDVYFYCLALYLMILYDRCTIEKWVTIIDLLGAWATHGRTRLGG